MGTINPQGAVKPLSLFVSAVAVNTSVSVELTNTDGTSFLADYIEVISASSVGTNPSFNTLFTVGVSAAGYIADHQNSADLDIVSAFGGWMGTTREPVKISIPGINISNVTIANRNLDSQFGTYIINYGIKFLEHSMKNRQTDNIGN